MQGFIITLIILVNFIFQSTIFQHIAIMGVIPNTALIIVVCIALLKGEKTGGIVGLCVGLLQDLIFSPTVGVNAFILFFIGYFIGYNENKLYKETLAIPFIFSAIATAIYHLIYYVFMFFLSKSVPFGQFFKNVVLIEIIYNSFLAMPIYRWFSSIFVTPSFTFRRR